MLRRGHVHLLAAVALAITAAASALAHAQDAEDAEHDEDAPAATTIVLRQRLLGVLNPMGAEHYAELAVRAPVGDPSSLLFMGAHLEGGAVTALSPVYAVAGGYVQISPLSFLVLRGQLTGQGVWPIGMSGAGHYGVSGYYADVSPAALPAEAGGTAGGFTATLSGTLQGMLPLGDVRLLFFDQVNVEYAELGSETFYYDERNDLVRARADWLVTSAAFLGLELDLSSDVLFRFGVYDDFRHVPTADCVANQVGPIAMLSFARLDETLASVDPFLRVGYHTHHQAQREDQLTVLGGVQVRYDLAEIR